jgi:exopolyphosphatase/guanosine-5'-triphosphate,3'-diphosphate pyrophosphatase
VSEFAERCHAEQPHSSHVQRLALTLFDALGERIGCTSEDRQSLADAALLHDAGYHISYERQHKHSYHLIQHADLLGLSPSEQVVVANVARYHRGARPKREQRNYGGLDKELRRRIKRLSALLRVADGFDRGHVSAVSDLKIRWTQRAIRITPVPTNQRTNMRLEMWGANRKSELLADVAGVPVEIVAPDGRVLSSDDIETGELRSLWRSAELSVPLAKSPISAPWILREFQECSWRAWSVGTDRADEATRTRTISLWRDRLVAANQTTFLRDRRSGHIQ